MAEAPAPFAVRPAGPADAPGLAVVQDILDGVDDVHFSHLDSADVVRHRLVSDIVDAYARFDAVSERRAAVGGGNGAPRNGPPTRHGGRRR